jgi:thiamine biosynthesis lipoprotein
VIADNLNRISLRAMGSGISIALQAHGEQASRPLAEAARWFHEVERCLGRFDPESDLCALNRASGSPMSVGPMLWEAIHIAIAAAEATDGLVTPTLLQAIESAGYDCSFDNLPVAREEPAGQPPATNDFRKIALDESTRSVGLPAGMRLDLGGTAKGWAADTIAARLAQHGPAQVDAGGDIAVSGPLSGNSPWKIAVASPHVPDEMLGVVALVSGGIATSGRHYRRWQRHGVWQHHIIDPRTGEPAVTDVVSATVVARNALAAEVAAKRVLIVGSQQGLAWLESEPALAGLVVVEDGTVIESQRMRRYRSRLS